MIRSAAAASLLMLAGCISPAAEAPSGGIETVAFDTNIPPASNLKPVRLSARLFTPTAQRPVAAVVITPSSGGVQETREIWYARALVAAGIAALVIDSFGPRGVTSTVADQSLVTAWQTENDAFAGLAFLARDPRIDAGRIGVLGVSKGGSVALHSAIRERQRWRGTGTAAFAAHVPIAPGCAQQHRNAETTGAPMFFMIGALDDYTGVDDCVRYVERLRAAGNRKVEVTVYLGARHAWEALGRVAELPRAEVFTDCAGLIESDGSVFFTREQARVPPRQALAWQRDHCGRRGAHAGGGTEELRRRATDDMIAFLRRSGF